MAIRKPTTLSTKIVKPRLDCLRSDALAAAEAAVCAGDSNDAVESFVGLADSVDELEETLELRNRLGGRRMAKRIAVLRDEAFANGAAAADSARDYDDWDYLDHLVEVPESKWTSPYLRRLAALEHCDEVLALHRAEAVEKAKGNKGAVEPALERELADLWCILEMQRRADKAFAAACEERKGKFRPW